MLRGMVGFLLKVDLSAWQVDAGPATRPFLEIMRRTESGDRIDRHSRTDLIEHALKRQSALCLLGRLA